LKQPKSPEFIIQEISKNEGLLVSPSAAANLIGALEVAREIEQGTIVTVFPDNAEKYGELLKTIF
jgi:cysteine synthase B